MGIWSELEPVETRSCNSNWAAIWRRGVLRRPRNTPVVSHSLQRMGCVGARLEQREMPGAGSVPRGGGHAGRPGQTGTSPPSQGPALAAPPLRVGRFIHMHHVFRPLFVFKRRPMRVTVSWPGRLGQSECSALHL